MGIPQWVGLFLVVVGVALLVWRIVGGQGSVRIGPFQVNGPVSLVVLLVGAALLALPWVLS